VRVLLDTCSFLWLALGDERLSPAAREAFENPDHEVFLSTISAWEISVKHSL
jgi:PIN domain nuclease of toxin-antitoxin system